MPLRYLILSIKKRPKLFHSPDYYTIQMWIRQGFLGLFSALVYFKNIQKFLFVCWVIVCDFLYGIHMQFFAIVPIISLKYVSAYKNIFTNRRTLIMMDIEGRQLRNSWKTKLNCEKLTKDMKDIGEPPALRRQIQR